MDRGGQAPRPASDIKHGKMAVVGLAGGFWPISNTPLVCYEESELKYHGLFP
jgi:hypothetical protein